MGAMYRTAINYGEGAHENTFRHARQAASTFYICKNKPGNKAITMGTTAIPGRGVTKCQSRYVGLASVYRVFAAPQVIIF